MPTSTRYQQERAELDAVLASGIFSKAPSLAQFLTYVCGKYFEGEAGQIKEYNIAVEALGRPAEFNQARDSIVRVEAHRVRKRLKQYYETDGAGRPVHIIIPPGKYVPEFVVQINAAPGALQIERFQTDSVLHQHAAPPVARHNYRRNVLLLAGLAVCIVAGWMVSSSRSRLSSRPSSDPSSNPLAPLSSVAVSGGAPQPQNPSSAAAEADEIRILAGSQLPRYTDKLGNAWRGDRYATGGEVYSSANHPILRTLDPPIFQTHREGRFSYDVPLKPRVYELRLYFAEIVYGEGNVAGGGETSRLFNVMANGQSLLNEFDVIADAGATNTADVKVFKNISPAPDGMLHLRFIPVVSGKAFVNAIEILPSLPGKMRPLRMVARDTSYVDNEGRSWSPDHYFQGGQFVLRADQVAGSSDPAVYRGERFGNFTYVIPVAKGRYTLTLKFAETWFGPGRPGGGGVGSRLFDVFCNRQLLLKNFDVFKEAGGSYRAIERKFAGLEPNAQGKLVLSFVPLKNYASVNAIEVME